MQKSLRLFANSEQWVVSCLSVLNMRVAGAKHHQSSVADVEMWPMSPDDKSVTKWTRTLIWRKKSSENMIFGWKYSKSGENSWIRKSHLTTTRRDRQSAEDGGERLSGLSPPEHFNVCWLPQIPFSIYEPHPIRSRYCLLRSLHTILYYHPLTIYYGIVACW